MMHFNIFMQVKI